MTNLGTPCNWLTFSPTTIPFFFWPITATRTRSPGRKTSTSIKLGRGRRIKIMINFKHWQFNQNEQNSSYSKKNPNWICLPRIHAPRHIAVSSMQIVILQKKRTVEFKQVSQISKRIVAKLTALCAKIWGGNLKRKKVRDHACLKLVFFLVDGVAFYFFLKTFFLVSCVLLLKIFP